MGDPYVFAVLKSGPAAVLESVTDKELGFFDNGHLNVYGYGVSIGLVVSF